MAATDDHDADRLPGRVRRRPDTTNPTRNDGDHDAPDDEIETVTRLMGFLRDDET